MGVDGRTFRGCCSTRQVLRPAPQVQWPRSRLVQVSDHRPAIFEHGPPWAGRMCGACCVPHVAGRRIGAFELPLPRRRQQKHLTHTCAEVQACRVGIFVPRNASRSCSHVLEGFVVDELASTRAPRPLKTTMFEKSVVGTVVRHACMPDTDTKNINIRRWQHHIDHVL